MNFIRDTVLTAIAYKVTDNFCYGCYKVVEGDQCSACFSDDFMRHLKGVGVEYGCEWVIEHLIKQHCEAVGGAELYEEILDECYPEIRVVVSRKFRTFNCSLLNGHGLSVL